MAVLEVGCAFWRWILQGLLVDPETGELYGDEYVLNSLKKKERMLKK